MNRAKNPLQILKTLRYKQQDGFYNDAPLMKVHDRKRRHTVFQILVSCIISQRTRDEQTAVVDSRLFAQASTPQGILKLGKNRLTKLLKGAGFYRQKAKHIISCCSEILKLGRTPSTMDELLKLPGVGRKTANIVLIHGFHKPAIAVDVHVHRIANRIGLVNTKTPEDTEASLCALIPRHLWSIVNELLVAHGQKICQPRRPKCEICPVERFCAKKF